MLVGIISGVVAGMTPIDDLGDLVNLGTLMAFTIICFTVLYMRIKEPTLHRPFKVPYPKVTPVLGMLSCCGADFHAVGNIRGANPLFYPRVPDLFRLRAASQQQTAAGANRLIS